MNERILLVEDAEFTRAGLEFLLRDRFPGTTVVSAANDEEAIMILEQYEAARTTIDVAVLDIKVPAKQGENAEVSDLCEHVSNLQPGALVVHITAHWKPDDTNEDGDLGVMKHYARYHSDYDKNPTVRPVSKNASRWEDDLCRRIASFLVSRQLGFVSTNNALAGRDFQRGPQRHQGASFRRADLLREIGRHWRLLDEKLQNRIKEHFDVDDKHDPVIVR